MGHKLRKLEGQRHLTNKCNRGRRLRYLCFLSGPIVSSTVRLSVIIIIFILMWESFHIHIGIDGFISHINMYITNV